MNIKNHIKELLMKIGLSDSEAALYLAAHETPGLTLNDLKKKTGVSLATIYRAYEKLRGKNFLSSSQNNWRKNVQAVSLQTIAEKLASQQRNLKKIELELKGLDSIYNLSNQSFSPDPVEIITDQNMLYEKYFQILHKDWEKILAYGSAEAVIDIIGADTEAKFVDIRCRKGRKADVVLTEWGYYGELMSRVNDKVLRNMKVLENENAKDYIEYIYGDELTIWHKDKETGKRGIVIKDPVLVNMHKDKFATLWNT